MIYIAKYPMNTFVVSMPAFTTQTIVKDTEKLYGHLNATSRREVVLVIGIQTMQA